jgi:nucleotide-binding universal stress UspA family protein
MIKKIIFPYDFSVFSKAAIPFIKDFTKLGAKDVIIVSVLEYEELFTHVLFKEVEIKRFKKKTEERLEKVKNELEEAGLYVSTAVDFGIPSKVIINVALEEKADIIIMGARGSSALANMFLGSTAENVLKRSPIPVLVVPFKS